MLINCDPQNILETPNRRRTNYFNFLLYSACLTVSDYAD